MSRRQLGWALLACVIALGYPFVFRGAFEQRLGALVLLYAAAASAWNILGGYAGYVSFGHALFFGCGAYSALLVSHLYGVPSLAGLPIGVAASLLIAFIAGSPTLRLSGHYFSMATIAIVELVRLIVQNTSYLGGTTGISGPAIPHSVFDLSFTSMLPYYYVFLAVLVLILAITWWVHRSRIGYYLRAIKDSERAARSLGVPSSRYKLYALALSAGLTSVTGSLFGCMVGFINPSSGFGIILSVKLVIIAALGSVDRIFGPLVGAIILIPIGQYSNNLLGGNGNGLTFVVYGAIIVLISIFRPDGILPVAESVVATAPRLKRRFYAFDARLKARH